MKSRRVLVLSHEDLMAPESLEGLTDQQIHDTKCERDVVNTLRELGHEVRQLGVSDDLRPIRSAVVRWKPHVVFNLLEEFLDTALFDHNVVAYLELLRASYTGCGPRGLVLTRDKSLAKKLMTYHRVKGPRFFVVRRGLKARLKRGLKFPMIVKALNEEASLAIAKASIVHSVEKLAERVKFVHEHAETHALVEEFIEGREVYVAMIGNQRLQVLPPQELVVGNLAEGERLIATAKLKHDPNYQKKRQVKVVTAELTPEQHKVLERASRRAYRVLELKGYARIDYRLAEDGSFYFLEANPNPELAKGEEVADAAAAAGITYPELIQKIVSLGMRH